MTWHPRCDMCDQEVPNRGRVRTILIQLELNGKLVKVELCLVHTHEIADAINHSADMINRIRAERKDEDH